MSHQPGHAEGGELRIKGNNSSPSLTLTWSVTCHILHNSLARAGRGMFSGLARTVPQPQTHLVTRGGPAQALPGR